MTSTRLLIDSFRGEHEFLSNFHQQALTIDGVEYRTAEHAFNAAKTLDPAQAAAVRAAATPAAAKRLGRRVTLRPRWDEQVRFEVMRTVLAAKFTDPALRTKLLGTGDALLVEGTGWHDLVWGGFCTCDRHVGVVGLNHLGRALMALRSQLRDEKPDRWPRVAVVPGAGYERVVPAELVRVLTKLREQHRMQVAITAGPLELDDLVGLCRGHVDQWVYATGDQVARDADAFVVLGDPGTATTKPTIVIDDAGTRRVR